MAKYDGTSLSAAHVGTALHGFLSNLNDGTLSALQGTKLQSLLDNYPEITSSEGTKLGNMLDNYLGTKVADFGALTDNSNGSTPDGAISQIGDTSTGNEGSAINSNFRDVLEKINAIRDALRNAGIMA